MTKKVYFDYAATTPIDPEVLRIMKPYLTAKFGNPSSLHSFGQVAMAAIDESREKIAAAIGANFREIIFTGSATEANNLALRGIVKFFGQGQIALKNIPQSRQAWSPTDESRVGAVGARGKKILPLEQNYSDSERRLPEGYQKILQPRIIVSAIEHESILETCRDLEKDGVEIIYLPVNKNGFVNLKKLKNSLDEKTILVSIMYANNEIGTIQNISAISEIIKQFREKKSFTASIAEERLKHSSAHSVARQAPEKRSDELGGEQRNERIEFLRSGAPTNKKDFFSKFPLFHTDAVQAFQFLDCNVNKLGIDLMTLSAHKIYGPKGIGALYMRQETKDKRQKSEFSLSHVAGCLSPIVTGGGQEFNLRSGTENVAAIVGFAKAIELAAKNRKKEAKRIAKLTNYFWGEIKKIQPKARLNGVSSINSPTGGQILSNKNLPNILNIHFPNKNNDELLTKFDLAGVAISSGSACSARSPKPSHVLKALGLPEKKIKNSLRFSLGKFTTKKETVQTLKILLKHK